MSQTPRVQPLDYRAELDAIDSAMEAAYGKIRALREAINEVDLVAYGFEEHVWRRVNELQRMRRYGVFGDEGEL